MKQSKLHVILIVTPQLSIGGAESQVVMLAKELKKLGLLPLVVSSGGVKVAQLEQESIRHINAPIDKKDIFSIVSSVRILRKVILEQHVSLIHCHAVIPTLIGRMAATGKGIPIVSTGHGWAKVRLPLIVSILRVVADHQIVISKSMLGDFIKLGFPTERVSLIYNGLNPSNFEARFNRCLRQELGANSNQVLIGMVSRISEKFKGHLVLINAFNELIKEFPNVRLAIIGDGSLRTKIEDKVQALGLRDYIHFTGNRQDISHIYAALDIVVLPSLREGFPVVLLEAMAAGKPIVATNVNGIPEAVVDGKTGILVSPNDVVSLINGIRELLLNKEKAAEMGRMGRIVVKEKFTSVEMAQKVKNLYIQLISRNE
jgi:glycosyltransferase involved in cell wall biosynthesis